MTKRKLVLFFALIFLLCTLATSESTNITPIIVRQCENCNFSTYKTWNISENSKEIIQMSVPSQSYFFIMQVHHEIIPITLSYERDTTPQNSAHGTNIGLHQLTGDKSNHTFYLLTNFTEPKLVLFVITAYLDTAPIPGGCNMEFNTEIGPYQKLTYDNNMITVDVQNPSTLGQTCETQKNVTLEFYHIFTEQLHDINQVAMSPSLYAITKFLTVESIKANGVLVVHPSGSPILRRYLSNHQGHESVIAVIATYKNMSSAYVPITSYGCDMQEGFKSCINPAQQREWIFMKIIMVTSFILLVIPGADVFVPFLNLIYFGTNAMLLKAGLMYEDYNYYNISTTCIFACLLTYVAHKHQVTKVIMVIYFGHILTSIHMFVIQGFEICHTFTYFWAAYVIILCVAILIKYPGSKIINIFHYILGVDAIIGKGSCFYFIINTVRVASVPNFYLANAFIYPENTMLVGFLIASMVCFVIYRKCAYNGGNARNKEGTPLNEHL